MCLFVVHMFDDERKRIEGKGSRVFSGAMKWWSTLLLKIPRHEALPSKELRRWTVDGHLSITKK
jgi:hypothetical protein